MHFIQKILLKRLHSSGRQRYSSLTSGYTYEDNILFHLNQLQRKKLIEKIDGFYSITLIGIQQITSYELTNLEDTGFKTFFLGFLCEFQNKFLIKEHPAAINNFINLPSGKPHYGENIDTALQRTFLANTGIKLPHSSFSFLSLHLKTIKTRKDEVLFDDAFCIYRVLFEKEELNKMKFVKGVSWKSMEEIQQINNRWPEIDILILQKNISPYMAYEFVSDYIL
jgi:hypothetical protein